MSKNKTRSKKTLIVLALWFVFISYLEYLSNGLSCTCRMECETDLSFKFQQNWTTNTAAVDRYGVSDKDHVGIEFVLGCPAICDHEPLRVGVPYKYGWCTCFVFSSTVNGPSYNELDHEADLRRKDDLEDENDLEDEPSSSLYCRRISNQKCDLLKALLDFFLGIISTLSIFLAFLVANYIYKNRKLRKDLMKSFKIICIAIRPTKRRRRIKKLSLHQQRQIRDIRVRVIHLSV